VAGTTYKFLLQGKPDGAGGSDYTAWFYAPENGVWKVLAQWKRPNTTAYLTGVYSFIENFNPDQGYLQRSCNYGNQWYKTSAGSWTEVTNASFSYDATASAEQRMDYQGGVTGNSFYLKNGGFFATYTSYGTALSRTATGTAPSVNLTTLP